MDKQKFLNALFEGAKNAGIEDCEAYLTSGDEFSVDILNGEINEYNVAASSALGFRGLYGGKMGYASTQVLSEEAVDELIDSVIENALLIQSDDEETLFEGSREYQTLDHYSAAITDMPAAEKIELAKRMEKAALNADARVQRVNGCSYITIASEKQIVNSKGLNISYRSNAAGAVVAPIVSEGGKVNFGFDLKFSLDKDELDVNAIAAKAVEKAVAGLNAESIPSGKYRVVLKNDMAATLLATFSEVFSAESAQKGLSLLKGREGEVIASDIVTIIDDPLLPDGVASCPFDAEGVATFTKTIVERGRLNTLLHNRKTAKKQGVTTTGNASKASCAAPVQIAPSNFYFKPSDMSFDALIESVGEGILITSLMGMHSGANQISGDFSLGAKGFLIQGGKLTRAVEQITIAGNFFNVLKEIRQTASDLYFGMPRGGSIGSPSLDIGEMPIAGK